MVAGAVTMLVVGGQRSGKSRYAEAQTMALAAAPVYLATATAGDAEMAERIAEHRRRRGAEWRVVEEPLDLPGALRRAAAPGGAVLVDCLTLWLANLMAAERDPAGEGERLAQAIAESAGSAILVSNEVGSGIIPDNALSRRYADALGSLNQRVATAVDRVVLVVAGQPLAIKGEAP